MTAGGVLVVDAIAIAVPMAALWAVSVAARDASLVDIFWGAGFAIVAIASHTVGDAPGPRATVVTALVIVWGLRLTAYLAWRNLGRGEDRRYQAMRRARGDSFWWRSAYVVFGLQSLLIWIVSLPVQIANAGGDGVGGELGAVHWVGVGVWAVGLAFEAVGDWQLARFKADPANAGHVMDRGLWRYTRHPNYFGDFLVWWGVFLVAVDGWSSAWTAVGPLVMSILLVRVSGVALLERDIGERRPGYAEYVRRTPAFVPWFPRP